jgi:acetate kinase
VTAAPTVLALNAGSSSLKVAVRAAELVLSIQVDRLGSAAGTITVRAGGEVAQRPLSDGLGAAVDAIAAEVAERGLRPEAVAHRVVHGGPAHSRPTVIDEPLLADLRAAIPLAPLHLPGDLDAIEHAQRAWPDAVHVACFDTGFHADLPARSLRLPVAEQLRQLGIRRYGFHGLSIQSVLHALPGLDEAVIAHLGSGCSVTAVAGGRSRHTTMSLTPTGGMVSATRSGDLDPEIVLYLIQQHGYQVDDLRMLFDRRSGIAGLAGDRHDLRDLLQADDSDAQLALDVFTDSAARSIAGCAVALDGWRELVFTGGVGEHSEQVRQLICARLLVLRGCERTADPVAALTADGVRVRVVPAQEELILDVLTRRLLSEGAPTGR